jgi:hypothetical protein
MKAQFDDYIIEYCNEDYISLQINHDKYRTRTCEFGDAARLAIEQFERLQNADDDSQLKLWLTLVASNGFENVINDQDF